MLPFDNIYKTSTTNWTNWYNGMIDSASAFDTDNIHSFENNLPLYIQESSEYNDMKDFLSLQGEQYDLKEDIKKQIHHQIILYQCYYLIWVGRL